ncbi:hypothetical protein EQG63_02315 [Flavobacterium amnicola]|uniref:Outer membrane protein beta-barrel domain-containing protein n=1 Tax=Flavobacterium amnicola TaxID=2506422 RepID=A0A4Q1K886_9FLAO|nr:outer membrane beta-barrel protein [Flavobacterium amnicola]RXR20789.1 hypothetical protein EQG63_02315 [Flavobacterium amnicola]
MKNRIVVIVLLFLSVTAISQNKKFSIDVNYPLSLNAYEFQKINGIIDASFKYRFKETNAMKLGASYTFDLLNEKDPFNNEVLDRKYSFHHLDVFSEFKLNNAEKLHPFVGIGYSMLFSEYEYFYSQNQFTEIKTEKYNAGGLNFNLGLSYDISPKFFIQSYFHYVRIYRESPITNKMSGINYNQIKLGAGFRF